MDKIIFKKIWQDFDYSSKNRTELYQINVKVVKKNISINSNFYVCDKLIND